MSNEAEDMVDAGGQPPQQVEQQLGTEEEFYAGRFPYNQESGQEESKHDASIAVEEQVEEETPKEGENVEEDGEDGEAFGDGKGCYCGEEGLETDQVFCDSCSRWHHCSCEDVEAKEVEGEGTYTCKKCQRNKEKYGGETPRSCCSACSGCYFGVGCHEGLGSGISQAVVNAILKFTVEEIIREWNYIRQRRVGETVVVRIQETKRRAVVVGWHTSKVSCVLEENWEAKEYPRDYLLVDLVSVERIIPKRTEIEMERLAFEVGCVYDSPMLRRQLRYFMRLIRKDLVIRGALLKTYAPNYPTEVYILNKAHSMYKNKGI